MERSLRDTIERVLIAEDAHLLYDVRALADLMENEIRLAFEVKPVAK